VSEAIPDRDVGERRPEPQRRLHGPVVADLRTRARAREHRARRVDDDEDLGVLAHALVGRPLEPGLRGRQPNEHAGEQDRGDGDAEQSGPRRRQPDRAAHGTASPLQQPEGDERHHDAERDERPERRQQRQVHQ
jgi:hypothetical protein